MKNTFLTAIFGLAAASAAHSADKPSIGPVPDWVKPIGIPVPGKSDDEPVRLLLSDQQFDLERDRQTLYSDVAFQIQTPPGLAAGNISIPWRPDTSEVRVHKLLIRRGDQVIDVLASGQTFTVLRREQNLESAALDGVLTANIQPEGLQVGDIVELVMSVSTNDPVMRGHVEQAAATWNGIPIERAHLRAQWPANLPLRLREAPSLPALKPITSAGRTTLELSLDNVQPIVPPKFAPSRYGIGRIVELTDFASWADLGALMAPLYDKAAVLPAQGPLRDELERIRSASPDPRVRAQAALTLVQDRVRYVALAMGAGGYVPADAETTWARRYGDCKGKTALMLTLLHAMDIEAEPVAVGVGAGDGLDERLPMVGMFNHVLVRATIAGKVYWFDGTRTGDTDLDRLAVPNFGWGLPLIAKGATLVRIQPTPLAVPNQDTSIQIDASAGIGAPAPTRIETILRGDGAVAMNAAFSTMVAQQRDEALKAYWKDQYDFIDETSASAGFDAKAGEEHLSMEGTAKLDWANGNYQTDGTSVGYHADFARDPGPDRDAPYAVAYPFFGRVKETIQLPKGFGNFGLGTGMEVDQTAGGIAYYRHAAITADTFTIEKTARSVVPEFPAKDAPAAQAALRMLDDRPATLRMPASYSYSGKDLGAVRADVPTTSTGYVSRAMIFVDRGLRDEALRDYDKAVELDPKNAYAWAKRGITRVQTGNLTGAKADLTEAEALDPAFDQNLILRAMIADFEQRPRDAIQAYSAVLAREPDNNFVIGHRAIDEAMVGQDDAALADSATALKFDPTWIDLNSVRAGLYLRRGERDRAVAEMRSAIAANPNLAFAHVAAGRIDAEAERRADALKEYDAALATEPKAYIYAERSRVRPADDRIGRESDIAAALKLEPQSKEALAARAALQQQEGDSKAALASLTDLIAQTPANPALLGERAKAYYKTGDFDHALVDSSAALKANPKYPAIYLLRANIFRAQGKTEEALAEAAAVEAASPDETFAHVIAANIYSTFHRDTEAIKAYDRALAIRPEPYIYLNRGYRRPKTDVAGRAADFDAALKLDPDFAEALAAEADLKVQQGDSASAIAIYTAALARKPDQTDLLIGRGVAYAKAGNKIAGDADFAKVRATADDASVLNSLCWRKATADVALESALVDCDAAVAKAPANASIRDSRAFVLLRLGRFDDAISEYDRVLAETPKKAASLFGRSAAWARKGDKTKADEDAKAALTLDPDVRSDFEGYGIKM